MTTVRETKRADELKPGDWLRRGEALDEHPAEVLATLPWESTEDGQMISVIFRGEDSKPTAWNLSPVSVLSLATEAEVDAYRDDQRRLRVAEQLEDLARLIVSKRLPLPGEYQPMHVTFNFGRDIEKVDKIAEVLGLERTVSYGTATVHMRPRARREGLLDIAWDAYAPKEEASEPKEQPEPVADPTGQLYSRPDDDPTPVSGARIEAHVGAVTDGGLVEVAEAPTTGLVHAANQKRQRDRRTCVDPGDQEHDHAMCEDAVAEDAERDLPDPTGLDEVPDEQLRETVHWATSLLPLVIACGAEGGPFAHRHREKVTCSACIETFKDPS